MKKIVASVCWIFGFGAVWRNEKSCRSRKMWKNEPILAIGGVDTEENEHFEVCPLSVYRSPRWVRILSELYSFCANSESDVRVMFQTSIGRGKMPSCCGERAETRYESTWSLRIRNRLQKLKRGQKLPRANARLSSVGHEGLVRRRDRGEDPRARAAHRCARC